MNKARLFLFGLLTFIVQLNSYANEITLSDIWINEAPPGVSILAAYGTIINHIDKPIILTNINSELFEKIELHESVIYDGVATMKQHDTITIPANGQLEFTQGGYHMMLFSPVKRLVAGEQINMTVDFDNSISISVIAEVRRTTHHHHHH